MSSSKEALLKLNKVLEDLLFAAKIPPEITEKYNYLKRSTFDSLGIPFTPAVSQFRSEPAESADTKYIGRLSQYCELFLEKILSILLEFLKHPKHSARMAAAKTTDFLAESDLLKSAILSDAKNDKEALMEMSTSGTPHLERSPSPQNASSVSVSLSSFFYKLTTIENKIVNALCGIEDALLQASSSDKRVQLQLSDYKRAVKVNEEKYRGEIEVLKSQLRRVESEKHISRMDEMSIAKKIDEAVLGIKQEHLEELNRLQNSHQNQLVQICELHKVTETNLRKQIDSLMELNKTQGRAKNEENEAQREKQLQERHLKEVIRSVQQILRPMYEKHVDVQSVWKREERFPGNKAPQAVIYADFMAFIVEKLHTDNNWFIARLAQFGQENERLRSSSGGGGGVGAKREERGERSEKVERMREAHLKFKEAWGELVVSSFEKQRETYSERRV